LSNVPLVFGALLVVGAMGTLIYVVSAIASAASPVVGADYNYPIGE